MDGKVQHRYGRETATSGANTVGRLTSCVFPYLKKPEAKPRHPPPCPHLHPQLRNPTQHPTREDSKIKTNPENNGGTRHEPPENQEERIHTHTLYIYIYI